MVDVLPCLPACSFNAASLKLAFPTDTGQTAPVLSGQVAHGWVHNLEHPYSTSNSTPHIRCNSRAAIAAAAAECSQLHHHNDHGSALNDPGLHKAPH